MVYINKGEHENPHELPKDNLVDTVHHDILPKNARRDGEIRIHIPTLSRSQKDT